MKIEKGTRRIAIVGERATLKFPKIDGIKVLRELVSAIRRYGIQKYLTTKEQHRNYLIKYLLRGWHENLREWRLSQEITGTIVPTRFSIFGLMNIQDTASDADIKSGEVYAALRRHIDQDLIFKHGIHTIAGENNFGVHEGELKIRDYGEVGLDVLLKGYGKQVKQALDETMAKIQAR